MVARLAESRRRDASVHRGAGWRDPREPHRRETARFLKIPSYPAWLRAAHCRGALRNARTSVVLVWNRTSRIGFVLDAIGASRCIHWEHGAAWDPGQRARPCTLPAAHSACDCQLAVVRALSRAQMGLPRGHPRLFERAAPEPTPRCNDPETLSHRRNSARRGGAIGSRERGRARAARAADAQPQPVRT